MLPKKDATKFMSECACLLLLLSHYPENISNRLEKQGRVKSPQLSQLRLYYIGGKSENISRRGRSPGEGHGNPHQYSCLQNPMDTEAWWAAVHRVAQSWTWLKQLSTAQGFPRSAENWKTECICVFMILNIWKDIPLVAAPAPRSGGTLFNSLPFDSLGFCIMCTVAFLIKKN